MCGLHRIVYGVYMMQRRLELKTGVLCEIVHWESTHEKTPEGIPCMVTTRCGYHVKIDSIRGTACDDPPTCLFCAAHTVIAWLG